MVNEVTGVAGSGQKDQLRRQLQRKLDSIAARLYREIKALSTEVDGGNFIDVAQGLERQEQEQLIASRLMEQARRLRVALTRLDDGEYGVCCECGARIPQKRLLAVPDAATCVACQDRLEHYRKSARCASGRVRRAGLPSLRRADDACPSGRLDLLSLPQAEAAGEL